MNRLSARARRTLETSGVVAAAGLLALIGAIPAHATPSGPPTFGYTRSATMPPLGALRGTTLNTPVRAAATQAVSIIVDPSAPAGFSFSPASVTANVGDTVTWTNNSPGVPHTTTSDSGSGETWSSPNLNTGDHFSHTFPTAGTFTYHCNIHPTMHGTVVIQAAGTTTTTSTTTGSTTTTTVAGTTTTTAAGSTTTTANVLGSSTSTTQALATTGSQTTHLIKIALGTLVAGLVVVAITGRRRVHD